MKFKCPKVLKFHGKLSSNQYSTPSKNSVASTATAHILDQYVKYDYDEVNFIITFIIHLPNEGQYGFDVYARDPDYQSEKRTMSHCCKYIINYAKIPPMLPSNHSENHAHYSFDKQSQLSSLHFIVVLNDCTSLLDTKDNPSASVPIPKIGGNAILLSQFGMSPLSHPDPSITLHSSNLIELQFQIRKMVDFTFDLIYHHTIADLSSRTPLRNLNQRLNASDYVTIKPNGGFNVIFALNLPQQGVYTFTIYAATTSDSHPTPSLNLHGHTELPAVFTYLIRYV